MESGGHDIPEDAIMRRYRRTVLNFLNIFAALCDEVFCYDNSQPEPTPVFVDAAGVRITLDHARYQSVLESGNE